MLLMGTGDLFMGLDCTYQALPEGCALLERAKRAPSFGELLALAPWQQEPPWLAEGGMWTEFYEEVGRLRQRHPGLEERYFRGQRDWDVLHYLLSEARRQGVEGDDWGTQAVLGARVLDESLRAGQGVPLRYSSPETVRALGEQLEQVTEADLRRVYVPELMEARAVYKFWADRADAEWWEHTVQRFEGLRAFYRRVAREGEGVLVVLD